MKNLTKRAAAFVLCGALVCATAQAAGYTDITEGAWYAEAVEYCKTSGLMNGTGEDRFDPDGVVSRGTLATVLHRLAGFPALPDGENTFTDVPDGAWYTDAVYWAARKGYMIGYGGGRFGPTDPITWEQLAVVLWRYMGSPATETTGSTGQGDVSGYAAPAVDWAKSVGVVSGLDDGGFAPRNVTQRSQLAIVMMNLDGLDGITTLSAMNVMCQPCGVAVMEDGSLLVTDTYNRVIWRVAEGVSSVYAGKTSGGDIHGQPQGGYNDANLKDSYFKTPWAIAPFLDGWAVSDTDNQVIRLIHSDSIGTLNGYTAGKQVTFKHPTGLASDNEGNLYVADTFDNVVYKIAANGEATTAAKVSEPMGLCWWGGALYIAESGANRVVKLENGKLSLIAGSGEAGYIDGPVEQAAFSGPQGVSVGEDGTVYVADTDNSAIRKIQGGQVSTLAVRDITDLRSFFPIEPSNLLVAGSTLYICDPFARKLLALPIH